MKQKERQVTETEGEMSQEETEDRARTPGS